MLFLLIDFCGFLHYISIKFAVHLVDLQYYKVQNCHSFRSAGAEIIWCLGVLMRFIYVFQPFLDLRVLNLSQSSWDVSEASCSFLDFFDRAGLFLWQKIPGVVEDF